MNPEVEGMVSELYALRAGLSAVSQEYDGFRNDCKKAYDALAGARNKTKQLEEQRARRQKKSWAKNAETKGNWREALPSAARRVIRLVSS